MKGYPIIINEGDDLFIPLIKNLSISPNEAEWIRDSRPDEGWEYDRRPLYGRKNGSIQVGWIHYERINGGELEVTLTLVEGYENLLL